MKICKDIAITNLGWWVDECNLQKLLLTFSYWPTSYEFVMHNKVTFLMLINNNKQKKSTLERYSLIMTFNTRIKPFHLFIYLF